MRLKEWVALSAAAWRRLRSPEEYRVLQRLLAEKALDQLAQKHIPIGQLHVLELGCGAGGYSEVIAQRAGSFMASDLQQNPDWTHQDIPFTVVDVTQPFPFVDHSFDLIFCSSVIEHVRDSEMLLKESWRVLKPGGWLYLSFPPFYSLALVGGHQFKPFHLLGERLALLIYNLRHRTSLKTYSDLSEGLHLYPLTIKEIQKHLSSRFTLCDTFTRIFSVNTACWPGFLKDLFTWHVCFLAQKT